MANSPPPPGEGHPQLLMPHRHHTPPPPTYPTHRVKPSLGKQKPTSPHGRTLTRSPSYKLAMQRHRSKQKDETMSPLPSPSLPSDDPVSPAELAEAKLTELHNFAEQYKMTLNIPVRERQSHHDEAGKLKMHIGHL